MLAALVFIWSGFVRAGLGFGGAVLALPLLLMIDNQPLFWLPILSLHLLVFAAFTLKSRLDNIDWMVLRRSIIFIFPAKVAGVVGLLSLPNEWLVIIIYSITSMYAVMWIFNLQFKSDRPWMDNVMLIGGGYFSGTSLSGAPLIATVYVKRIARESLRDTMFILWVVLVGFKAAAFVWYEVDLQIGSMVFLIPVVAIGHFTGIKIHQYLIERDRQFKLALGTALILISSLGIFNVIAIK